MPKTPLPYIDQLRAAVRDYAARGVSLSSIAKRAGVTRQKLGDFLAGRIGFSPPMLITLAEQVECSIVIRRHFR